MAPGCFCRRSRRLTGNKKIKSVDLSPSGLLPILRPLLAATLPFAAVTLAFGLDASPARSAGGVSANALYVDTASEAPPEASPVVDRDISFRQAAGRNSSGRSSGKSFVAATPLSGRHAASAPVFAPASFAGAISDILRPASGDAPDFVNFTIAAEGRASAATPSFDQPLASAILPSVSGPGPSSPDSASALLDPQGGKPGSAAKPALIDKTNPGFQRETGIYFPVELPPVTGFYLPAEFQPGAGDHDPVTGGDPVVGASGGLAAAGFGPGPEAVTPVPEPATYAFMLAGLGLVGFVAGNRRRARCD